MVRVPQMINLPTYNLRHILVAALYVKVMSKTLKYEAFYMIPT